jgi:hypothetical protein
MNACHSMISHAASNRDLTSYDMACLPYVGCREMHRDRERVIARLLGIFLFGNYLGVRDRACGSVRNFCCRFSWMAGTRPAGTS